MTTVNFEFLQVATNSGMVLVNRESIESIEDLKSMERVYSTDEIPEDDGGFILEDPALPS